MKSSRNTLKFIAVLVGLAFIVPLMGQDCTEFLGLGRALLQSTAHAMVDKESTTTNVTNIVCFVIILISSFQIKIPTFRQLHLSVGYVKSCDLDLFSKS